MKEKPTLTVAQVIERLQKCPQDAAVFLWEEYDYYPLGDLEVDVSKDGTEVRLNGEGVY